MSLQRLSALTALPHCLRLGVSEKVVLPRIALCAANSHRCPCTSSEKTSNRILLHWKTNASPALALLFSAPPPVQLREFLPRKAQRNALALRGSNSRDDLADNANQHVHEAEVVDTSCLVLVYVPVCLMARIVSCARRHSTAPGRGLSTKPRMKRTHVAKHARSCQSVSLRRLSALRFLCCLLLCGG